MKHLKNINLFCLCILMAASCSNEDAPGITQIPPTTLMPWNWVFRRELH